MSYGPPTVPPFLLSALAGYLNKKYLHISFYCPPSLSEMEAQHRIQPIINTADDWLKYAPNCWIVWTGQTPQQWYEKFAADPELKEKCSILVLKVDLSPDNRAGQLQQWAWDWLAKPRT